MKIKIQITVESDKGQPKVVQEVAHLDRFILRPETLGLTLAEAWRSTLSHWYPAMHETCDAKAA
jgi:hypothetical protein